MRRFPLLTELIPYVVVYENKLELNITIMNVESEISDWRVSQTIEKHR